MATVLALVVLPHFAFAQEVHHPTVERPAIVEIDTVRRDVRGEKEHLVLLVVLPYAPEGINVRIRIFDLHGRLMGTVVKTHEEGSYIVYKWDKLGRLPNGQYVAKLEAGEQRSSRRFTVAR